MLKGLRKGLICEYVEGCEEGFNMCEYVEGAYE